MSARSDLQDRIVEWLQTHGNFDAPYGILTGEHGKYRSIVFGIARYLDAEVRIYSPTWLLLTTSDRGQQKFASVEDLLSFIRESYCPSAEP